jgi:4'-phosphopantetheinyl transferase
VASRHIGMTFQSHPRFPLAPALSVNAVHVVRFLPSSIELRGTTIEMLDESERARAARFFRDRDRQLFIAAHAATRIVLGRCLKVPPDVVRFRNGEFGKPELNQATLDLRFNLTHADDRGMIAIGLGRALGIDLERKQAIDALDIARHFFSPSEYASLAAMAPTARLAAFYRSWTCKESFAKALGRGLSLPLMVIDVGLDDKDSRPWITCGEMVQDMSRWATIELAAEPGYAAALTVEGLGWHLIEWDLFATDEFDNLFVEPNI